MGLHTGLGSCGGFCHRATVWVWHARPGEPSQSLVCCGAEEAASARTRGFRRGLWDQTSSIRSIEKSRTARDGVRAQRRMRLHRNAQADANLEVEDGAPIPDW